MKPWIWTRIGRPAALALALIVGLGLPRAAAAQVESVRLADTIKSSGSGNINLLLGTGNTPIPASQLEALRLEHVDLGSGTPRNFLSFGVDVNENNKGLETSTAQGVTVASVQLTVNWPNGVSRSYSEYRTATQALLAAQGKTQRSRYYTLLGEGGSSRITGANSVQQKFDSTLDLFVPDSLAGASSMQLSVQLLTVNKSMNEPENFYDFSGGFEDLAILNRADAYFLNATLAQSSSFRSGAPAVEPVQGIVTNDTEFSATPSSWSYYPSASDWYQVAYEDNYPNLGDYDFNDAVVAYRYKLGSNDAGQVVRIEAEAYLLTDGATYPLAWSLRIPVPGIGLIDCTRRLPGGAQASCNASLGGGQLQVEAYPDIDNAGTPFGGASSFNVNTQCGVAARPGAHMRVVARLGTPVARGEIGTALPVLRVAQTGHEITPGLKDSRGVPFALLLPPGWSPPCEGVDMGLAYPRLKSFLSSGGASDADWYLSPVADKVVHPGSFAWDQ